jgi:hypothetical protein
MAGRGVGGWGWGMGQWETGKGDANITRIATFTPDRSLGFPSLKVRTN